MKYLAEIDFDAPDVGDLYDELPLWSAPFGLLLLDRVPVRPDLTILDIGAGTGSKPQASTSSTSPQILSE